MKDRNALSCLKFSSWISVCLHGWLWWNQCGGSGMFIPDPRSWFLPIPDPGSKNSNKRERWKKNCCHTFLCSHKFHKIVNYFSFEVAKKKIWANFLKIMELFTKKFFKKLLKIWSWDPGSEIRDPEKTYSGSRIQGSKRHRIPDPQHWMEQWFRFRPVVLFGG